MNFLTPIQFALYFITILFLSGNNRSTIQLSKKKNAVLRRAVKRSTDGRDRVIGIKLIPNNK
jgi:hypothetical protein